MRIIIISILLSITLFQYVCSQSIQIQYEFVNTYPAHPAMASKDTYELISTSEASSYTKIASNLLYMNTDNATTKSEDGIITEKISDEYYRSYSERKDVLFKDFKQNHFEYNTITFKKEVFVREKLGEMEWTLTDQDTTFLDFPCKIATTTYKGRKWTVFFTDQLNFNAAPWKFNGLPGVVLYAISDDKVYSFSAVSIKTHAETLTIENPFGKKEQAKMLSWEEYKKEFYAILKKMVKKMNSMSEDGEPQDAKITVNNPMEDLGFTEVN